MSEFVDSLEVEFRSAVNNEIMIQQKAYMKGQFEYFGIKSPLRNELSKPFLNKAYLPAKEDLNNLIRELWEKPQRDFQYFAQTLCQKYVKTLEEKDLELFEYMIITKSWWDTIDFIASNLVGPLFTKFPHLRDKTIKKWMASNNIWLQRTCLLFQLKYKDQVDRDLLSKLILELTGGKEFFINKAIGWSLRSYSRVDPEWVKEFVHNNELSNLSKREALKLINRSS